MCLTLMYLSRAPTVAVARLWKAKAGDSLGSHIFTGHPRAIEQSRKNILFPDPPFLILTPFSM